MAGRPTRKAKFASTMAMGIWPMRGRRKCTVTVNTVVLRATNIRMNDGRQVGYGYHAIIGMLATREVGNCSPLGVPKVR